MGVFERGGSAPGADFRARFCLGTWCIARRAARLSAYCAPGLPRHLRSPAAGPHLSGGSRGTKSISRSCRIWPCGARWEGVLGVTMACALGMSHIMIKPPTLGNARPATAKPPGVTGEHPQATGKHRRYRKGGFLTNWAWAWQHVLACVSTNHGGPDKNRSGPARSGGSESCSYILSDNGTA